MTSQQHSNITEPSPVSPSPSPAANPPHQSSQVDERGEREGVIGGSDELSGDHVDAAFSSPPRQFLSAPSDASSNGLTRPIRPSAADADSSVVDLEQEIERLADELEKKRFELGKVMKQESSGQRAVDAKVDEEMSGETEQPVSTSSIPGDNDSTRRRTLSPLLAPSDTATTPPPGTVRPPSTAAAHATATNDLSSLTGLPIESSNSSALSRWAGTSAYDSWSNRDDIGEYVAPREQYSKPKFVAQDHEYNELEVVAHLEHLEATVVAKDEEVVLVRSRLKQVENDWDEALFAKKMVEDELAEVKVRAAKKVARIEEKMAKRVGEKEREIEELKYRLAGGFGASGATGGGEDVDRPSGNDSFSSYAHLDNADDTSDIALTSTDADDSGTASSQSESAMETEDEIESAG